MARRRAASRSVCSWCIPHRKDRFDQAYTESVRDVVARPCSRCCGTWPMNVGYLGPWTDLNGQELPGLKRPMFPVYDGKGDINFEAPLVVMETPHFWSYRNPGRFYAEYKND